MPFSEPHARAACNFFEGILKHTMDEWYGQPFILCPWQEEALCNIFGSLDEDGNRIIELAYLEVVKKSGKTEMMAGVVLLVLMLTSTPGCQVYGAASATRQALNVYRAACKMVEQSPILRKHLRIMRGTNRILKRSDPDSFYAAVAADGDFGDGVNPAFVVADEVHRWKTRKQLENWDVLSKGGITRRQTLTIAITTAGVQEESPLAWRLHEKTRKIQAGVVSDPRFFGRIYGAEKTDNPGDPATWIKANPSLLENGGFLDKDKIRKEYESAVAEGDLTSFKRYFLNIWDQKEDRAIDMGQWDASAGRWQAKGLGEATPEHVVAIPPDHSMRVVRPLHHDVLAHFIGRRCWAGVDMSLSTDLTAVALVFPRESEDTYEVLPFFWLPDKKIRRMEMKLGVPLAKWAREGFLELSPGDYIDYRDVQARLVWAAQMFDMQEMCFDPAYARQVSGPFNDAGHRTWEVRQCFTNLNEPTKKILELVVRGALHHGNHPVMRWNAGSACTVSNNMDLMMFAKPLREKSTARIDGMSATATAMHRAIAATKNLAYDSPASVAI